MRPTMVAAAPDTSIEAPCSATTEPSTPVVLKPATLVSIVSEPPCSRVPLVDVPLVGLNVELAMTWPERSSFA